LKKYILAIALALSTVAVTAQTSPSVFATVDYVRGTGSNWNSSYENYLGARVPTSIGTFDLAAIYNINYTDNQTSTKGVEGGYSLTTKFDNVDLTGRLGFGGVSYDYYYVIQGEAKYTLDTWVKPVVQVRFKDGTDTQYLSQTRGLFGADFSVAKDTTFRLGYTYTYTKEESFNGITGSLNVGF